MQTIFHKICLLYTSPVAEQEQFAVFVEQTDKSKVAVQKALDEAQLLFDSLMQLSLIHIFWAAWTCRTKPVFMG